MVLIRIIINFLRHHSCICTPPRQYAYDEDFEETKYELALTPAAVTAPAKEEGESTTEEGASAKEEGAPATGEGASPASAATSSTGGVGALPKVDMWLQPCAVPQTGLTASLKAPDRLVNGAL